MFKRIGIFVILVTIAGLIALFFSMDFRNFITLLATISWSFTLMCCLMMFLNWLLNQKSNLKPTSRQSASTKKRLSQKRR